MTSNLGSEYILEHQDNYESVVFEELKSHFRPEFINRIDEIITFNSLNEEVIYEILDKIISDLERRLAHLNLKISLTKEAKDYIINNSFDPSFGARPIKRFVTKNIETLLANSILNNEIQTNSKIEIDVKDNTMILKKN